MVIRFYDFEFNLIHIEPKFVSSLWRVYFNAEGTFESHFPNESEAVSVVMEKRYLVAAEKFHHFTDEEGDTKWCSLKLVFL